ncbi:hypothetical protein B296_00053924, partial [Ensete ventricosum]
MADRYVYLETERAEGHFGDGGDVEVENRQPEVVQARHHLQQLLRPPPGEDLQIGVGLHHGHLDVGHSRPVLLRLFAGGVVVCS